MKKTVTINISGIIFHIDEDAYERLNRYMSRLKRHFSRMEGREEIITDIEARIAELLQEKMIDNKQVISIEDIEDVVKMMGEPSEMETGDEPEPETQKSYNYNRPKRLYRDPDNRFIAGVSSGLAAYFNIVDPLWIRLLFIVFTFIYGFGPIAYIVLWILAPKAITTAEKLEMRGEPVNISNIERSFRDGYDNVKGKFDEFADGAKETVRRGAANGHRNLDTFGQSVGKVVLVLLKVFVVILGLKFILAGLGLLTGFVLLPVGVNSFSFFDNGELVAFSISNLVEMVFSSTLMGVLGIIGLLLFIGVPLIMMIYLGIWLITIVFGKKIRVPYLGLTAVLLWLSGLVLVATVGLSTLMQFRHTAVVKNQYEIDISKEKPLYIKANDDAELAWNNYNASEIFDGEWKVKTLNDDYIIYGVPDFSSDDVSSEGSISLNVSAYSKGFSRSQAYDNAENIVYDVSTNDSTIFLPTWYHLLKNEKLRDQRVNLKLVLPIGQRVHFDVNMKKFFNENPNYYYRYENFEGKTWIMTETGLKPYVEGMDEAESYLELEDEKDLTAVQVINQTLSIIPIPLIGL